MSTISTFNHPRSGAIAVTSKLYIDRLVKELNATPDSFYMEVSPGSNAANIKCRAARRRKDKLQVRAVLGRKWMDASPSASFCNPAGKPITASRRP